MSVLTGQDVVVDALPYIDHGYDEPGVREAALAMVDDETRRYRPTKNYLEHLPALNLSSFVTSMMKKEYDRLGSRQPMDTLSMKRYELPTPPAGKMTDVQAWTECVDNSLAQLEHQRTRILNLDLMLEYGGESWKVYNEVLQDLLNRVQSQLGDVKKEIQEVNWARKNQQTQGRISDLKLEFSKGKNYEIEQALLTMEYEYSVLKSAQQKK